jgi:16S rRNA (cytosine967-C5)-methyltransferase
VTKNSRNFRPRGQHAPQPLPQGLQPRIIAAAVISEVAGQGLSLDDRLAEGPAGRMADLEPRDRALVRSIATVSLRRLGTIRAALGQFLEKGLPRKANQLEWLLVAGAAQILFLDVPDHAAVDLAVHAARRDPRSQPYASLVNAVLRNIARARDDLVISDDPFIDTPQWLAARWRQHYGEEQARLIAQMHQCEPTLDLTVKGDGATWAKKLNGLLLPQGSIRLIEHTPISELPGYEEGAWWVQDAAASLPARLLNAKTSEHVLDLCAAPGGKTAQLAVTGAEVTALDRSAERMKRLSVNLERLGLSATLRVGDALTFEAPAFDAILLDAPCSATGTIRRHPDVAWIKRASDITSLAGVQARMLDHAMELLKPGGRLVYCTCSLEPEEGEQQISALLRRNPDVMRVPISPAEMTGLEPCINAEGDLRTLPCHLYDRDSRRSGLDGFFAARLTRRA